MAEAERKSNREEMKAMHEKLTEEMIARMNANT
jgi:hypothetical protein